jgi:hypothetical protein
MSIFAHHRWKIFSANQHPYKHTLSDFAYTNPALGSEVSTLEGALNWFAAVLYPQTEDAVANVAALPASGNTLNDYRVVNDDGDGKAAGYRWEQREGEVSASWHKIYDFDWGADSILAAFQLRTQDLYVHRQGYDDLDSAGVVVAGTLAGQRIFGGKAASSNLTLSANSGDGTGAQTGYVQVTDHFRPTSNNALDLGTTALKFRTAYLATSALVSTMTLSGGSIVDSSGAISFDNENLSTTGTLASGTHTIGNMVLSTSTITNSSGAISFDNENLSTTGTIAAGASVSATTGVWGTLTTAAASITDSSGSISFDNENLLTTGTLGAGNTTVTRLDADNLRLDGNTLSSTNTDGNIILSCNGTGLVDIQSALTTVGINATGTVGVTGQLNVDNLRLDGNTLSSTDSNGNVALAPNGAGLVTTSAKIVPTSDGTLDLGATGSRYNDIFFDGGLGDGTTVIAQSVLQSLRDINSGVDTGYSLFWNGSKWVSSAPDTEIDHGTVSGLTDDDHTQYALLAGRSGGQSLNGGTASGNNLTLDSTSDATKGSIFVKSDISPNTTAAYSGGWTGTNLGGSSKVYNNVYTAGEFVGFRLENLGALPASSSQRTGRLLFYTSDSQVYLDNGASVLRVSMMRYEEDTSWDGSTASKSVTVSGLDARKAQWQLKDNTNDFEIMAVKITSTGATNVTITANSNLPAGSYRLIGIQ